MTKRIIIFHQIALILLLFAIIKGCEKKPDFLTKKVSKLQQVINAGKLEVLTRFDATTYYETGKGFAGLEYDLVQLFAEHLGVKAEFTVPDTFNDILSLISQGKADIAAAGLTATKSRSLWMQFAPPYSTISEQIVYRSGSKKPRKIEDLADGNLEVVAGTSHVETLTKLKTEHPDLDWDVNSELDTDSLLYLVHEGLIDYTVADSNQVTLVRRYYPDLKAAFELGDTKELAWGLAKSADTSLYDEVVRFFEKIKRNKTLDQLLEKHYGHATTLGYVDIYTFRRHVKTRLPKYEKLFKEAAEQYGLDWRFVAAIGYQESHWRVNAVSPTGVRGIMMLTQVTAKQLGLSNRLDPNQSIFGGTKYFLQRKRKLPGRIKDPDRTWMALAAYNVGFGHLEDARILTQKQGLNPDKWIYVKQSLPLLSQKKWHKQTKYGFARGWEPVRYVENIRGYYDLLVWLTSNNRKEQAIIAKERDNEGTEILSKAL